MTHRHRIGAGCRALGAILAAASVPLLSSPAGASDSWVRRADMPTARLALSVAAVDGKIYAMGGYFGANSGPAYDVEVYDPTTDTWERRASMQTPRRRFGIAVAGGLIYTLGGNQDLGSPPLATVEVYDPVADRWSDGVDMPTPRFGLTASVVDGKIYAIGGVGYPGGVNESHLVEEYDPATRTWTRKTDSPVRWELHAAAVVDGQIYLFGGVLPRRFGRTTVYRYDPASDTWMERAPLPEPRGTLAGAAVNGRVYAIGGRRDGTTDVEPESTVFEYDPVADAWTERAPMAIPRTDLRAAVVDGRIYAVGGTEMVLVPHPGSAVVEEYTPPAEVADSQP